MDIDERSQGYVDEYKILKKQADERQDLQEEIRDYILPRTGRFDDQKKPGEEDVDRYDMILDATATRSLRVLAAGMQGGLTSPARPWFRLGLYDESLMDIKPIAAWIDDVQKRMYALFARSNFYNSIHKLYKEEAGYGQAVCIVEEDPIDTVRFTVLTCGEYFLAENERGMIDTLYRILWMQAKQIEKKFGKGKLPQEIKDALKPVENGGNPYEWFKLLHVVKPRKGYDPNKIDAENMAFESVYIAMVGDHPIIRNSGFIETPLAAPRWETNTGEPYGRSPGHDVLPDTKMLQELSADLLSGLQKLNDPPLKGTGGLKHEASHMAGSITYSESTTETDSLKPIYEVKPDVAALMSEIQDVRLQIREGLYNDLFLMLNEPVPNMTATEIAERHEEKLLMLGPVIERQFYELLTPIIDRVFAIMDRNGMIPPPPPELMEAIAANPTLTNIKIEFISLLAQAQKLVTTQSIRAVSDYVVGMSQAVPDILDNLDVDQAVTEFQEATGAPSTIIRSREDVIKIRKARAAAMAEQQRKMDEMQAAQTMKDMGGASTEEGTALGDLKRVMEGA